MLHFTRLCSGVLPSTRRVKAKKKKSNTRARTSELRKAHTVDAQKSDILNLLYDVKRVRVLLCLVPQKWQASEVLVFHRPWIRLPPRSAQANHHLEPSLFSSAESWTACRARERVSRGSPTMATHPPPRHPITLKQAQSLPPCIQHFQSLANHLHILFLPLIATPMRVTIQTSVLAIWLKPRRTGLASLLASNAGSRV